MGPEDREPVVSVLCEAFRTYPVMTFVLGRACASADDPELRALVGFYADRRLLRGWPVLGLRHGEELAAATLVTLPEAAPEPPEVVAELARLKTLLGPEAFTRMQRFEAASDANEPPGPHWFVGMIGVRPALQGLGHGRTLLTEVHRRAQEAGAPGVCLSTEYRPNVGFYESLGYEVVAHARVDDLETWCLYRETAH